MKGGKFTTTVMSGMCFQGLISSFTINLVGLAPPYPAGCEKNAYQAFENFVRLDGRYVVRTKVMCSNMIKHIINKPCSFDDLKVFW